VDDDDAKYYNEQIKLFEHNSEDTNMLLKHQLSVVRSSLGAINNTLADVEYNGNLMKECMNEVTKYMNVLTAETNEETSLFRAIIEVEGHILRVNHAMRTVQRKLDLLIDSVIHAHKGVLQPQIVSPVTLMEALIKSVSTFPKDRVKTKCGGTRAETRFGLSAKWTSPFLSAGVSVQSTAGSRSMRISGSNAG